MERKTKNLQQRGLSISGLYRTADLYLAAFLRCRGLFLKKPECMGRRVFFIFDCDEGIDGLVQEYLNGSAVDVLAYKSALMELKSLIYRTRENGHD